jgi:hypothetical protein
MRAFLLKVVSDSEYGGANPRRHVLVVITDITDGFPALCGDDGSCWSFM